MPQSPSPSSSETHAARLAQRREARAGNAAMRRMLAKRAGVLAAVLAVPAMAAPGEWRDLQLPGQDEAEMAAVAPQPFEQPGQSFPGSAFFYLEDAPQLTFEIPAYDPSATVTGSGEAQLVEAHSAGPAARRFAFGGSGLSMARAQDCLTKAVYYEAASESEAGQRAVAQVVLNRVAHPSYPNSVCGVVFQGSQRRTGCQFSFTCDGSLARKPSTAAWSRAGSVARRALAGEVFGDIGLATHYHTHWVNPYWASSLRLIGSIGAHRFYRWRGAAGKPDAFRSAYAGFEPTPVLNTRRAVVDALPSETARAVADPLALARAFEQGRSSAAANAPAPVGSTRAPAPVRTRAPAPAYSAEIEARGGDSLFTADKLPGSGTVKPEYANSGRWIAQPGEKD